MKFMKNMKIAILHVLHALHGKLKNKDELRGESKNKDY